MKLKFLFQENSSFFLIFLIVFNISLHLFSTKNNNFYFTVDQGRDALEVREIIIRKNFPLKGPRTGAIENLFVGPLWYFLITPGYLLNSGHPWGAVWLMVIINTFVLVFVYKFSQKYVNCLSSFFLTLDLIILDRFWYSSQFALNPNILPALTIGLILSLIKAFEGKKWGLFLAGLFSGMVIHSELAFVPIAFITFLFSLLYLFLKKRFPLPLILKNLLVFFLFLIPHFVFEITNDFLQSRAVFRAMIEPKGVFGTAIFQAKFFYVLNQFGELFGKNFIPQNKFLGLIIIIFSLGLITYAIFKKKLHRSLAVGFFLTLFMIFTSLIWFSTNKEFLLWHILGLYSVIFIIFMLCFAYLKNLTVKILFWVILSFQALNFLTTYSGQTKISSDQGIFKNQLDSVDWVYQESREKGFNLYSYLQFVYDFPYQYTVWWRGTKKYGYLPCEYSTYPDTPSSLYFQPIDYYQSPRKKCTNLRFLIIEPTKDKSGFEKWYQGITTKTNLLKTKRFGKIRVEKRIVK